MVQSALIIAVVYWLLYILDPLILSWQCLNRPIVVAPIIGLVLGDFNTGIVMGASLESIFMGISAIGGSIPADAFTSSIIAVAFTILGGGNIETGLALALPIGTLMASFNALFTPIWGSLAPYWEKLAQKNIKQFTLQNFIFGCLIMPLPGVIVMFISIAYGVDGLNSVMASLPAWVMTGFGAASSMMIGVGFAILASMIWSKELGCFFFIGYVLVAYLKLASLPIAIIGAAIAITMFLSDKKFIDFKNENSKKQLSSDGPANGEEDFF
ncbi:MAG: PTS sugar transporter subunit IIC [Bacilli bacterium]